MIWTLAPLLQQGGTSVRQGVDAAAKAHVEPSLDVIQAWALGIRPAGRVAPGVICASYEHSTAMRRWRRCRCPVLVMAAVLLTRSTSRLGCHVVRGFLARVDLQTTNLPAAGATDTAPASRAAVKYDTPHDRSAGTLLPGGRAGGRHAACNSP